MCEYLHNPNISNAERIITRAPPTLFIHTFYSEKNKIYGHNFIKAATIWQINTSELHLEANSQFREL